MSKFVDYWSPEQEIWRKELERMDRDERDNPPTEAELSVARQTQLEVEQIQAELDAAYYAEKEGFKPLAAWQNIGQLAAKALAKQPRYRSGEDPQAERAILMRLHGLSYEEAIQRWPLSEYFSWRRTGL